MIDVPGTCFRARLHAPQPATARSAWAGGLVAVVAGVAFAGCGGGHPSSEVDAAVDAPSDAAEAAALQYIDVEGLSMPPWPAGPTERNPNRLRLLFNGNLMPSVDGFEYLDDGTFKVEPEGTIWRAAAADGETTASFRRPDAPTVEILSTTWTVSPFVFDDPLYFDHPLPTRRLLKDWLVIDGPSAAYQVERIAINYNPTPAQTVRIYIANGRGDSAVSARFVELDDMLAVKPNGRTAPIVDHVAAGSVREVEVPTMSYLAGIEFWTDAHPDTRTLEAGIAASGNFLRNFGVPGDFLLLPAGTIFKFGIHASPADHPEAIELTGYGRFFWCRDDRYRAKMIEVFGPCEPGFKVDTSTARIATASPPIEVTTSSGSGRSIVRAPVDASR